MTREQRRKTRQERIEYMKEFAAVVSITALIMVVFAVGVTFGLAVSS